MNKEITQLAREIADRCGLESQISIAQEECAELIQALSKLRRVGLEHRAGVDYIEARCHVTEEMADVQNLLIQLAHLLENETLVLAYLQHKLARTKRKIEEESHGT